MAEELLYTSAPRGLHPGSRGYCTVLQSRELPKRTRLVLESASSYRWAVPPSEAASDTAPVNYAHVTLRSGLSRQHVLSRVAAYGFDYTHRTNHIAHHVVLQPDELPAMGPAWLLSAPSFMRDQWDSETQFVTPVQPPNGKSPSLQPCTEWARAAGDAGWAGAVAQEFLKTRGRHIYLIFPIGMSLLPLMQEVSMILPEDKRWNFTFSTYFTDLPGAFDCRCRCVLADGPECHRARQMSNAIVVDFTSPTPLSTTGPLVELARTGRSDSKPARRDVNVVRRDRVPQPSGATLESEPPQIRPPDTRRRARPARSASGQSATPKRAAVQYRKESKTRLWFAIAGVGVLALVAGVVAILMTRENGAADQRAPTTATADAELKKEIVRFLQQSRDAESGGNLSDAERGLIRARTRATLKENQPLIEASRELTGLKEQIGRELKRIRSLLAEQLFEELKQAFDTFQKERGQITTLDDFGQRLQELRVKQKRVWERREFLDRNSQRDYGDIQSKISSAQQIPEHASKLKSEFHVLFKIVQASDSGGGLLDAENARSLVETLAVLPENRRLMELSPELRRLWFDTALYTERIQRRIAEHRPRQLEDRITDVLRDIRKRAGQWEEWWNELNRKWKRRQHGQRM